MSRTLVVNFFGAPGSGKSTMTADLFAKLKWAGIDCEIVSEFAKDLVWENRSDTFEDQVYIFAKQNHRIFRLNNRVKVIITDSPLAQSIFYDSSKSLEFKKLVLDIFNSYNNMNYYVNRKKAYNPNGRNQTEDESNKIAEDLRGLLDSNGIPYKQINGTPGAIIDIFDNLIEFLGDDK